MLATICVFSFHVTFVIGRCDVWGTIRVRGEELPLTGFGFVLVALLWTAVVSLFVWLTFWLVWVCM
jgi:hypothetical protein